jgi:copper chaperone
MKNATFDITGMSCSSCVRHVDAALRRVPGVDVRQVAVGSAEVAFDPTKTSAAAVVAAIAQAGYSAKERDSGGGADRLARRTDSGHGGGCCCG